MAGRAHLAALADHLWMALEALLSEYRRRRCRDASWDSAGPCELLTLGHRVRFPSFSPWSSLLICRPREHP